MRDAIALADYFTSHSLAAFDAMGADRTTERARTVLEALRTHKWSEVSKRDLMASSPAPSSPLRPTWTRC
ncbi:hypothetical protein [Streptomyces sp. UG1]|uniref:hypothetical protein n=1 Tax=Streptomyces sp. UG1 TaxID=3417652 RepID=UPI003CF9FDB6